MPDPWPLRPSILKMPLLFTLCTSLQVTGSVRLLNGVDKNVQLFIYRTYEV